MGTISLRFFLHLSFTQIAALRYLLIMCIAFFSSDIDADGVDDNHSRIQRFLEYIIINCWFGSGDNNEIHIELFSVDCLGEYLTALAHLYEFSRHPKRYITIMIIWNSLEADIPPHISFHIPFICIWLKIILFWILYTFMMALNTSLEIKIPSKQTK